MLCHVESAVNQGRKAVSRGTAVACVFPSGDRRVADSRSAQDYSEARQEKLRENRCERRPCFSCIQRYQRGEPGKVSAATPPEHRRKALVTSPAGRPDLRRLESGLFKPQSGECRYLLSRRRRFVSYIRAPTKGGTPRREVCASFLGRNCRGAPLKEPGPAGGSGRALAAGTAACPPDRRHIMSEALNLSKAEAKRSSRRDDAPQEGRKMRSKEQTKDDADVPTKPASELATKPEKENPLAGASSEPKPGKENSAFEANNSTTSSTKTLPGGGSEFLKDMSSGVKPEKTDGFQPEYRDAPAGPAMHLHPLHPTAIPGLPGYGHLGYGLFPGLHPAPRPEEALAGCEDVEILYDSGEPVIEVECGENKAFLYINKLCQGSKGPSIRLSNEMLTPNEFQFISGRETAKDWKRSIRHKGKSLKTLMAKGILQVHPPICDCPGCRISSPVVRKLSLSWKETFTS
ncbi:Sterile alpha motif [Branchiostoma belcheri]|nr:Sterile alpha motif [Branchiostoma belcheri]